MNTSITTNQPIDLIGQTIRDRKEAIRGARLTQLITR